ncbi:MBL fold metallo-hydrolase [Candidatus Peregrinibacteria bacterium]|jgi:hydroxyacylglutathione hydrolase|nr:MBL fold metallo-hydrolase [Candidatus Peregrinibacteria bacterium]
MMNTSIKSNMVWIPGRDDSLEKFSAHSFLISGDEKSALIDPGSLSHQKELTETSIAPDLIIATHEHWDHVAAADFYPDIPKLAHPEAIEALNTPLPNVVRPTGHGDEHTSQFTAAPSVIDLGNLQLEVVWTPGHTRGSMCLYEPSTKTLFAGDTVFADGGVGRIFFTGNREDYKQTLTQLVELAEQRGVHLICPGHGDLVEGEKACLDSLRASYHHFLL